MVSTPLIISDYDPTSWVWIMALPRVLTRCRITEAAYIHPLLQAASQYYYRCRVLHAFKDRVAATKWVKYYESVSSSSWTMLRRVRVLPPLYPRGMVVIPWVWSLGRRLWGLHFFKLWNSFLSLIRLVIRDVSQPPNSSAWMCSSSWHSSRPSVVCRSWSMPMLTPRVGLQRFLLKLWGQPRCRKLLSRDLQPCQSHMHDNAYTQQSFCMIRSSRRPLVALVVSSWV